MTETGQRILADCLSKFREELHSLYEKGELEQVIAIVFEKVCGLDRTQLTTGNAVLKEEEFCRLHEILGRLASSEPVQYVLGEAWFMGLPLSVNPSVLIPRPETEELTSLVIDTVKGRNGEARMIDICTGSGCIAIALKKAFPMAEVTAFDNSMQALQTAALNADVHDVQIDFRCDNLLMPESFASEKFDVVVSNPPYIGLDEADTLSPRVRQHEPANALFAYGDDLLIFYRALARFAAKHLVEGGSLFLEINPRCSNDICDLLQSGGFTEVVLHKDLSGASRFVTAKSDKFENHPYRR